MSRSDPADTPSTSGSHETAPTLEQADHLGKSAAILDGPIPARLALAARQRRVRWSAIAAGLAAVGLFGIVVGTRKGTVEVTSPDGTLPADVKVVVARGGE